MHPKSSVAHREHAPPAIGARAADRAAPHPLAVGAIAFLTLVDLFAAQAILPVLARQYAVAPSAMAAAVNSCTLGMALGAALCGSIALPHLDRRRAVAVLLALLALPTLGLAFAPDLTTFAALRIAQGVLMSAAFALSLAHLSEAGMGMASASVAAAYITGNVASNLFGRLLASWLAGAHGTGIAFTAFAGLNLAGTVLALAAFARPVTGAAAVPTTNADQATGDRIGLAPFAIGFSILFAFIGVFSYVGFVLMSPPLALSMMQSGFVYLVFVPSLVTTPLAKPLASRIGEPAALRLSLGVALVGLPLLVSGHIIATLAGLALVALGTFLAQAVATGYVGRHSGDGAVRANALYLASYFTGGLAGSTVVGLVYETWGWSTATATVAASLVIAFALAGTLPTKRRG